MRVLAGAAGFLRSNWRPLAAGSLALSAVLAALILLLPDEYQKDASIAVRPSLTELQRNLGQTTPAPPDPTSRLALEGLRDADLDPIEVTPTYDSGTQTVRLRMFSSERSSLEGASDTAVSLMENHLQTAYAKSLGPAVETQLAATNRARQENQSYLEGIEAQSEALPPGNPVQESLRTLRANALESRARLDSKIDYLERAREDLPRYTAGVASVEVVEESGIRRAGSPVSLLPYAVVLSLLAAVAATLRLAAGRGGRAIREAGPEASR